MGLQAIINLLSLFKRTYLLLFKKIYLIFSDLEKVIISHVFSQKTVLILFSVFMPNIYMN
jgi:hypothetical protein